MGIGINLPRHFHYHFLKRMARISKRTRANVLLLPAVWSRGYKMYARTEHHVLQAYSKALHFLSQSHSVDLSTQGYES